MFLFFFQMGDVSGSMLLFPGIYLWVSSSPWQTTHTWWEELLFYQGRQGPHF